MFHGPLQNAFDAVIVFDIVFKNQGTPCIRFQKIAHTLNATLTTI